MDVRGDSFAKVVYGDKNSLKRVTKTSKPPWEPAGSSPRSGPSQGHYPDNIIRIIIRVPASDRRQQLTVKAAQNVPAEELPLDWVCVDLQGVALQGHHEDAPAL